MLSTLFASERAALFLSLLLPVLASTSKAQRAVHSVPAAPEGWTKGTRAPADTAITLRLSLPAADESALHETLVAVSTPGHSRYGQHLTREEAGALVAPAKEDANAVESWLAKYDLAAQASVGGNVLHISTTVGVAEDLLAPAEYWLWTDGTDESRTVLRSLAWGVPNELDALVETAQPTNLFPVAAAKRTLPRGSRDDAMIHDLDPIPAPAANSTSCATEVTPACIRERYTLGNYTFKAASKNSVAVYSEGGYSRTSWMKKYLERWNPKYADTTWKNVSVNTTVDHKQSPDTEATLDLDMVISLAAPTPVTLIDVAGRKYEGRALSTLVDHYLNLEDSELPKVASLSYGDREVNQFPEAKLDQMLNHLCKGFGQLGTRGMSVIVASGDDGTTGEIVEQQGADASSTKFQAGFPASCPYVTTVGATHGIPEVSTSWSAGGFSDFFPRPSWQDAAVKKYLKFLGKTDQGLFNRSNRGFPDVSAFGLDVQIYDGRFDTVSGTSCSTPIFAAIVAALNDHQLAAGKSSLGFLNPWIYGKAASTWQDVTQGNNGCCGQKGFNATTGWDPLTGLGTPDFQALLKVLP